jgi:thiamine-phosphate pyrophosphorylase
MSLPSLCLIADRFVDRRVSDKVAAAVVAGVEWVQLRAHVSSDRDFARSAEMLVRRLREIRPDILISVNSRLEIAENLGVAFHTGVHGPSPADARKALGEVPIGVSVHSRDEGLSAVDKGADYLIFSPIFETRSKPGAEPAGLEALSHVAASSPVPVVALGGIEPSNTNQCVRAGAAGIAVLSGILGSPDIASATAAYLAALSDSNTAR